MPSYAQIIRELESRGIMPKQAPSLGPTKEALKRIGYFQSPFYKRYLENPSKVIVVAGTNGKGSVCAMLEALLSSAGERVGLYTSPHLVESTERIRIAQKDVSRELFCEAYRAVMSAVQGQELSHFEILTIMAVWIFSSGVPMPPVDRILLEVGLGGTWDSTNAVPHGFCVITSLGMDHQNLLGNTLPEIAANKLGILTPGAAVIHTPFPEEVAPLALSEAKRLNARLLQAVPFEFEARMKGSEPESFISTRYGKARLTLAGKRGAQNAATALTAFESLGYDPSRHLEALSRIRWPGRMQRLDCKEAPCPVYLSGDHNPQGVQSLVELLPNYPRAHLHAIVGVGWDKDLDGVLSPLYELADTSVYLTETPFKGRRLDEYGGWRLRAQGAWADPDEAFRQVLSRARPPDLILVTGSLYLVGAVIRYAAISEVN